MRSPVRAAGSPVGDSREAPPDKATISVKAADKAKFDAGTTRQKQLRTRTASSIGTGGVAVGGTKLWPVRDIVAGSYTFLPYVLQAIGDNIEVWVQEDTSFPAGDCRNAAGLTTVTRAQAEALAVEFDDNILPKESAEFSVAPARDGSKTPLDVPEGYFTGDGDTTVALVSNVRDQNYYAPKTPDGATYIGGFFTSTLNNALDRNVMTIDSWDWIHRTGANPPGEVPPDGTADICSSDQKARPRNYEGIFAHEYQHLLHYYTDPGEDTWLNEGLSDYAQTLVGYVDTTIPYGQVGADAHITCFQGFYGTAAFPYCGAENSLTRWSDQGAPSILSDYGAAYTFITYLADHFGTGVVKYLHTNKDNGLASLQNYLDDNAPGLKSTDVVHDWLAQMALDRLVDNGAKGLTKDQKKRFTSAQLNSAIDWAWTGSYDSPGAPTNGADFVLGIAGRPVDANTITSMRFRGDKAYAPDPLASTIDDNAVDAGRGGGGLAGIAAGGHRLDRARDRLVPGRPAGALPRVRAEQELRGVRHPPRAEEVVRGHGPDRLHRDCGRSGRDGDEERLVPAEGERCPPAGRRRQHAQHHGHDQCCREAAGRTAAVDPVS
jgi:hypothetical protein